MTQKSDSGPYLSDLFDSFSFPSEKEFEEYSKGEN